MWTEEVFARTRPAIAMGHLDALPGAVTFDTTGGLQRICEHAAYDYNALADNGIDAVIFCNENDKPYTRRAGPETTAAMTAVVSYVMKQADTVVPFGIDIQWDPMAAISVAAVTGAVFARGIMCGTFCGDLGFYTPDPLEIVQYRKRIGAEGVKLITNLVPEFSYALDRRDICLRAQTVAKSSMMDGICVSGTMAGGEAPLTQLISVKQALTSTDMPVFANTGVTPENVRDILSIADGCITATCLKVGRNGHNRIDPANVRNFVSQLD